MLNELNEKVGELYEAIEAISKLNNDKAYLNETETFINNAYKNLIAKVCDIPEDKITYEMVDLARNYMVYEEAMYGKRKRYLTDEEYKKEVRIMNGEEEKERPKDRINKLYEIVEDKISDLRSLGTPEDEVRDAIDYLTIDIFKNTISDITGINVNLIPYTFVQEVMKCSKRDKKGIKYYEKYTDPEIIIKAKEEKLYEHIARGRSPHNISGRIERLDYACHFNLSELGNLGINKNDIKASMNDLTEELYIDAIADILDMSPEEVDDDFVSLVR